jgi:anti-sigma regulatory factor (Ser/Thr protein kinase)
VAETSRGFRRDIESLGEVFQFLEDFIDEKAVDEGAAFCINLVVEELFTNMVKYNVGGRDHIAISAERVNDHVLLELIDWDVEPFDPGTVKKVAVSAGISERNPGGLGLHLVQKMVDDLDYTYDPETRRMRVSVTKVLEH